MQEINSATGLRNAILELENRQDEEGKLLREQGHLVYESMKPINLIKSTFEEVAASQEIKDELVIASVGLAAGYVSKKIFEGAAHSPLRKLFGTMLMYGVTKAVTQNPEVVKSVANGIFKVISIGIHSAGTSHNRREERDS